MADDDKELSVEDKFTDLELKYSFQENTLAELNDALVNQQQQLDAFKLELTVMKQHMAQLAETPTKSEQYNAVEMDEKPPHY